MNPFAKKQFDIMFNPDEEISVTPNGYGYMSVPYQEILMGSFVLSPQTEKQVPLFCSPSDIQLVAINPIKGKRQDASVTAFRTFMVEMDKNSLDYQYEYIKKFGMPYSFCVFSGGKSLHFGITLDEDLPSEDVWRHYMQWILNILADADQQAKNPSRGIRVAGNVRDGNIMRPVHLGDRIPLQKLQAWLSSYGNLAPRKEKKEFVEMPLDIRSLPEWVVVELDRGVDTSKGRNNRWFAIAYECGLKGWNEDDTIAMLENFFSEDRDFKRSEWASAIKSGVKKARKDHE